MEKYRITFNDDSQMIVTAGSINQAIASAIRHDRWDREIVKVERWAVQLDEPAGNSRTLSKS
jgi:hypothetical protein